MNSPNTRRAFIQASAAIGTGLFLSACGRSDNAQSGKQTGESGPKKDEKKEEGEVTATEDLMREHGVLRRALLVYTAAANKLRANPASVPPEAVQKTAKLFRAFGEDYHEKKLEEPYIFPAVKKAGGPTAGYPDILVVQHDRGREITDYILSVTQGAKLGAANAEPLARAMESLVLMYQNHAAREDTIVFPAWKKALPEKEFHEMGEKFEEIEHQQFGEDGFETAVKQIGEIEGMLGLTDISQFTAPSPPKA
jgi:hemerythrin-like domain-containing protein